MTVHVALLRAVNVGGTGKLPMSRLPEFCAAAGLADARTCLASGNVVFRSRAAEAEIRDRLEARLAAEAGKPVGVLIRSCDEIAAALADNPFARQPGNRVMALFTDAPLPQHPLDGAVGADNEQIRVGRRALFIFYPDGMGRSRLRLPAHRTGTARNMNTVARLVDLARELDRSAGA